MIEALGGTFELDILQGYPPTVNSHEAVGVMFEAMRGMLGEDHVQVADDEHGRRGFQLYGASARRAASCAWACITRPGTQPYFVHRADFRMDEDALPIGAAALAAAAVHWMQTHS